MPLNYKAFSINADGLLRVIMTKARIRLAQSIASALNIPFTDCEVDAIWDTGATNSSIGSEIVKQLDLKPIGKTTVISAGNKYVSNVYKIDVWLPNSVGVLDVRATEAISIEGSQMLIGMDIITLGDLSITNSGKKTCCSFRVPPDTKHIDYVEDWRKSQARYRKRLSTRKKISKKRP